MALRDTVYRIIVLSPPSRLLMEFICRLFVLFLRPMVGHRYTLWEFSFPFLLWLLRTLSESLLFSKSSGITASPRQGRNVLLMVTCHILGLNVLAPVCAELTVMTRGIAGQDGCLLSSSSSSSQVSVCSSPLRHWMNR